MSDPILHLAISAESCVFVKQSRFSFHCGSSCEEHPFFRSYGIILPSSLTKSHSRALGFSPHPPVSVYGTGRSWAVCAVFLGSVVGRLRTDRSALAFSFRLNAPPDFSWKSTPTTLARHPSDGIDYPSASPLILTPITWFRNINRMSITYAFRPRLRPD